MIVEPTNLTKKSCHQYKMPMSKLTLKQNGHSSINENRADDDYGGGGHEKSPPIDTRKSRLPSHLRVDTTRWWLVHFIQRFIVDPKRTLTRSRSATDATRFLRHIQARISTAIKCEPTYNQSPTNSKRRNTSFNETLIQDLAIRKRSHSVPNHGVCW